GVLAWRKAPFALVVVAAAATAALLRLAGVP
ncbi:AzlD domain-containing protein, partial [Amycolatopsis mediterranei]